MDFLTIPEAAAILRCSEWHVRRLMASGALAAAKHGRRWTTTREAIDGYHAQQITAAATPTSAVRRRRRRRAS